MPKENREARSDAKSSEQDTNSDQTHDAAELVEELDLDALDLSIETAEERISPSETNVFDK